MVAGIINLWNDGGSIQLYHLPCFSARKIQHLYSGSGWFPISGFLWEDGFYRLLLRPGYSVWYISPGNHNMYRGCHYPVHHKMLSDLTDPARKYSAGSLLCSAARMHLQTRKYPSAFEERILKNRPGEAR